VVLFKGKNYKGGGHWFTQKIILERGKGQTKAAMVYGRN